MAAFAPSSAPYSLAGEYEVLNARLAELMPRLPCGSTSYEVEGVLVHVAPDVMFLQEARKPGWHEERHREQRKEMINLMCVRGERVGGRGQAGAGRAGGGSAGACARVHAEFG